MRATSIPWKALACFFGAAMLLENAPAQSGLDRAEAIGPFLNGKLPSQTPVSDGAWTLLPAFPNLTFIDPVQMLPVPGTNRMLVLEKAGRLVTFENDSATAAKTVLIDFRNRVESQEDSGALGIAFHPEYGVPGSPNRDYLYLYYRFTVNKSDMQRAFLRLSRLTWSATASSIDPGSEQILINQYDRHNWHNGGGMFFGPEGFLYLALGDEGGANDQYNATQSLTGRLLGGVIRIDVDRKGGSVSHPIRRQPIIPEAPPAGWPGSYTQNYFIPNDNPWLAPDGSRLEEFWCIGTRSPHRMTRDPVTGDIYLGDIGQSTREEISLVTKAANLQWPYREGSVNGPKARPNPLLGTDRAPLHDYGRGDGGCVIGGYVYRGRTFASALGGKYVFGDHNTGRIWALTRHPDGTATREDLVNLQRIGPGPKNGLSSFALDNEGELYVLSLYGTDLDGGRILKLARSGTVVAEPPLKLSETGAFSNTAALTPAPGLIPYGVNAPLWTDGADKQRWMALPNDGRPNTTAERIVFSENGHWVFPKGTVIVKQFDLRGKRIETRFLVLGNDGEWYGMSYRWKDDGSDADLLFDGEDRSITAGGQSQTWTFPSRSQCLQCHNASSGRALGVNTRQLNGTITYPATGRSANQLVTLNRLGFFTAPLNESLLNTYVTSAHYANTSASLELRARSYLDANCAHCHNPAGGVAEFDYRLTTPLSLSGVINGPIRNAFGVSGAREVVPGDPGRSMGFLRQNTEDASMAMPPLGRHRIDAPAMAVVRDWITSLEASEYPAETGYRYARFVAKSEVNGNPWTSVAEFNLVDAEGRSLDRSGWRILSCDSEEPYGNGLVKNILDGNPTTMWHTSWYTVTTRHPHEFVIDLGRSEVISGFRYLPRQNGQNGRIKDYEFYLSNSVGDWGTPVSSGQFPNNTDVQASSFSGNHEPLLGAIGAQSGSVGQAVALTLSATDQDGDVLTYTAVALPAGLTLDGKSGRITGTPTKAGTTVATLSVNDGHGGTDSETVSWNISQANRPPVLGAIGGRSGTTGQSLTVTLTASDPDGDRLTFAASGLPGGLVCNAASGMLSGIPTASGVFAVSVTVSDGRGGTDAESFTLTISGTSGSGGSGSAGGTGTGSGSGTDSGSGSGSGSSVLDGRLLKLPFDEGAGLTVRDVSGSNRKGTLSGGATWMTGRSGTGVACDGVTGLITIPHDAPLNIGAGGADFTIAFWYQLQAPNNGQWHCIAKKGDQATARAFGIYLFPNSTRLGVSVSTSANWNEAGTSASPLTVGEWTHIALLKRGSRLELYLDGVLDAVVTLKGTTLGNPGAFYLGRSPDDAMPMKGAFDDFQVFERALSEAEVLTLLAETEPATEPTEPAPSIEGSRWSFDEGSGTTAMDAGRVGGPGLLQGGTQWVAGKLGQAVRLNGVNGHVKIAHTPALNVGAENGDFTVGLWVNLRRSNTGQWRALAKKGNTWAQRAFGLYLFPDSNRIGYSLGTDKYFNESGASTKPLVLGQWTHVALVRRGKALELWLDGALESSTALKGTTVGNPGAIYLGYGPNDAVFTRGDFDDFRVLTRALSGAEISQLKDGTL